MSGRGKGAAKGTFSTMESETQSNGKPTGSTTSVTDKEKEVC